MTSPLADAARWQAWDGFVATVPAAGFMQSSAWARFRERVGFEHFAVILKDGDEVVGGALVGKRSRVAGDCFYYIQDGPVLPEDPALAEEVFDAVLAGLRRHAAAEGLNVSHLRIEPRWQDLPAFVRGFSAPPFDEQRYREPRHTLCIDLRPSEEDILAQMKPKGRYSVRLARRHGVEIVEDNSPRGVEDFIRIQRRTADRQRIGRLPPIHFRQMVAEVGGEGRMSLYFAEYRGRRLATALVVRFGDRATYFYGGSLVLYRRVMAPYLLHFEIMRSARAAGCRWYDLWGVAPADEPDHPWQRISAFKRKLGGVEVRLVQTLDCVFDAAAYERYWRKMRDR
jgi:lipid II:glycine glycyltransferase (peptidoglycan interpeptide bridge formation enzyme)